jgi:DNA-binding NarL/FixJ family response regulator
LSAEITLRLKAVLLREEILAVARRARIEPLDQVMESPTRERDKSPASRLRLTTREQEVLALVMEGRTNRQIGSALYITEKTASVHVSNILTKLGVANRGEAAAAARRLGLAKQEELSNRA